LVAYSLGQPDPILNAEIGAIINSIRSALDLLASALASRNGVKPSSDTHFPIRKYASDFRRITNVIKRKKWLSENQISTIKTLRPYRRGNSSLYSLHQLDIVRKHERLIEVRPHTGAIFLAMFVPGFKPVWRYHKNKTVTIRLPAGTSFVPTESNCRLTLEMEFNEPSLGFVHKPVIPTLRDFATLATDIIKLFDS
jgi:hypothetical protein